MTTDAAPLRRARRNVAVLTAAQAVLGAQMAMLFTVAGLAGQMLSPVACLATLPISMIVLGSMLAARPLSALMQARGRRAGFLTGTACGAAGAAVSAAGLWLADFRVFAAGALLNGVYMSAQGFYRFAAADTAPAAFRPRAISYVLGGGLAAALVGPQLVKLTAEATVIPFLGTYVAVVALNAVGSLLFLGLDIPRAPPRAANADAGRSTRTLLTTPVIAVAIICAMVSYALMNLVMTSTPLAVVGCGFTTATAADIVAAHVVAMFAPSFVTGHVIGRLGAPRVVALGLVLLAAAGATALAGVALANFYVALVLLGVGWNFGFIGATTMLTDAHGPAERGRVQGLNDTIVFGCVTLASLASGGLMNCTGGGVILGWAAVNLAMVPLLALAGVALWWLVRHGPSAGGEAARGGGTG